MAKQLARSSANQSDLRVFIVYFRREARYAEWEAFLQFSRPDLRLVSTNEGQPFHPMPNADYGAYARETHLCLSPDFH
jgi:hypothetical protein